MLGPYGWRQWVVAAPQFHAQALPQGADLVILDESFAAIGPESLRRCLGCVLARAPTHRRHRVFLSHEGGSGARSCLSPECRAARPSVLAGDQRATAVSSPTAARWRHLPVWMRAAVCKTAQK